MYNQLVYFVVVLLLFGVQRDTGRPAQWTDALYIAALFCFFAFYCRFTFKKLKRAAARAIPTPLLTRAHYRAQALLSISAIGFMAFYLYVFNLGAFLHVIPGYDQYMTVSGIVGLAILLLHFAVIWFWSWQTHQMIHGAGGSRAQFMKGQLSFTSVVLVPWFLISTVTDILQATIAPSFIASDFAQTLLISVILFGFTLLGPWLIVRMWGCKPLPDDYARAELERFCSDHNFRTGGLLLWSVFGAEMLTAGVVGILPGLRYILITSGLLRTLNIAELQSVVAHEMGHVRKKHMLLFAFLFILFILFASHLSDTLAWVVLSNGTVFNLAASLGDSAASAYSHVSTLILVILMVVFFRFIFGYFLRNSERQADLYAMELVGTPQPLISSLEKIAYHGGRIEDLPSWHHFSIRQRIDFLVEAFNDRTLVSRHNKKLYGSALILTATLTALLLVNLKFNESGLAKNFQSEIQLRAFERFVSQQPYNPEYISEYGALLYEKGRYSDAESVLRAALTIDPKNATVLNNLAWLYATGPFPFRNPNDALELALKAANLSPAPEILDTLAEAYYINGRYADALETIDQAISGDGPQRNHFLEQRDKFQKALTGKLKSL